MTSEQKAGVDVVLEALLINAQSRLRKTRVPLAREVLESDIREIGEARTAVAGLIEDLQKIADGTVGRGQFTALDLIHEYQRIVRAALARVQGGAA